MIVYIWWFACENAMHCRLSSIWELNINDFAYYFLPWEWRLFHYYSPTYHFTAAFRITLDWFNIRTVRARVARMRTKTQHKKRYVKKGRLREICISRTRLFRIKKYRTFCCFFFVMASLLLFSIAPTTSGVRVCTTRDIVEHPLSSLIA